jgi:hypothetical protein
LRRGARDRWSLFLDTPRVEGAQLLASG